MKKLKHLFCIALAAVVTMTSLAITPMETKADDDTIISVPITVQEEYNLAEDFYELLNQKRADAGKYKYILDDRLMDLAMERATQNCVYYSHKSMTYNTREYAALEGTYVDEYGSYEDFFKGQLFQENIAEGLADAQSTYTVWHGSSGHNAVMMDSSNFKYCGVGVVTYHGKKEWVLVVSKAPVGNTIDKVSGSRTNTRTVRAKTKYFSRKKVAALDEWVDNPFAFSDIESGRDGYYIQQAGIFTFKNNNPELVDIDSMGRLKPKANGKGTFTVYYKNIELCTVSVTAYHDEEESVTPTPTPSPKPTEPPKQTETAKPTSTPDPQPPKQTETTKPAEPPKQTETAKPTSTPNPQPPKQTETTKPAEPPKQTEPSKPVKPVSRKLTVKVKNVTYNGKAQKPAITVYAGKKKLSSKYYTVSYKNNKNVGYGTVVVKGKGSYGKYSGTAVFKINLKKTKLSSAKSTKRKTFTTTWKKTGGNSGWQVQYSTNKKFRSGVRIINLKASNTRLTARKLKSRKNYYVRIRSYKKVGKQTWYSGWSNVKCVKIK